MLFLQMVIFIIVFLGGYCLLIPVRSLKIAVSLGLIGRNTGRKSRSRLRRSEILKQEPGRIIRLISTIRLVLAEFKNMSTSSYIIATCIFMTAGFMVGQLWGNLIVSFILAGIGSACPYMLLKHFLNKRIKEKDEKLMVIMGDIQSELVQTLDFVKAVKNKLPEIKRTSRVLYDHFKWFVDMIYLTPDDNIPFMEQLAERVDNYFFSLYMKHIIGFAKGQSMLVYTAQSIPTEYRQYLSRMHKYARIVREYNKDFITKIILLPVVIGFLRIMSRDFYEILIHNIFGQATLILVIISYIAGTKLFTSYNKEIRLEE